MAASRLAIATPPPAYVLSRGIGWQVIKTSILWAVIKSFNIIVKFIWLIAGGDLYLNQGIGVLLDGLYGSVTGSTVSV